MAWGLGLDRSKTWEPPMHTDINQGSSRICVKQGVGTALEPSRKEIEATDAHGFTRIDLDPSQHSGPWLRGRPGALSEANRAAPATCVAMPRERRALGPKCLAAWRKAIP